MFTSGKYKRRKEVRETESDSNFINGMKGGDLKGYRIGKIRSECEWE
jgi:hypothetical protein